ncbi:hypothetical protein [Actinomadura fibrosa]|uniref:Uncharacterized protein n=1 Tax=Actinomadura fibrosa TaxID=111802 RepID=A0ABW2XJZ9_9ACTN|nr:hypothetical protein [Actinomadura fibrosa]
MRPRDRVRGAEVPGRLLRFEPADWPGDWSASLEAWKGARLAFVAEHGDRTELGDAVDVLADVVAVKRGATGPRPFRERFGTWP